MDQVAIHCQQCGKGFKCRKTMNRHGRNVHGLRTSDKGYVFMTKGPVWIYECNDMVEFMRANGNLLNTSSVDVACPTIDKVSRVEEIKPKPMAVEESKPKPMVASVIKSMVKDKKLPKTQIPIPML